MGGRREAPQGSRRHFADGPFRTMRTLALAFALALTAPAFLPVGASESTSDTVEEDWSGGRERWSGVGLDMEVACDGDSACHLHVDPPYCPLGTGCEVTGTLRLEVDHPLSRTLALDLAFRPASLQGDTDTWISLHLDGGGFVTLHMTEGYNNGLGLQTSEGAHSPFALYQESGAWIPLRILVDPDRGLAQAQRLDGAGGVVDASRALPIGAASRVTQIAISATAWVVDGRTSFDYGPLRLGATEASLLDGDCGTGADAPSGESEASPLTLPVESCTGAVPGDGDHVDLYSVFLRAGTRIETVLVPAVAERMHVCIHAPRDLYWLTEDARPVCATGKSGEPLHANATATGTGTWLVSVVSSATPVSGAYTLSIVDFAGPHDDCRSGTDAGDAAAPVALVAPVSSCEAQLRADDTADWYAFDAGAGDLVVAEVTPDARLSLRACLHPPAAGSSSSCRDVAGGETARLEAEALGEKGTWRVSLAPLSGEDYYELSVFAHGPVDRVASQPRMAHASCTPNLATAGDVVRCTFFGAADAKEVTYSVSWTPDFTTSHGPFKPGRPVHAWAKLPEGAHQILIQTGAGTMPSPDELDERSLHVPVTVARGGPGTQTVAGEFGSDGWLAGYAANQGWLGAHWVVLAAASDGTAKARLTFPSTVDLDVRFHDAARQPIRFDGCATIGMVGGEESCAVPAGAAYALIHARLSPYAPYEFTYTY